MRINQPYARASPQSLGTIPLDELSSSDSEEELLRS